MPSIRPRRKLLRLQAVLMAAEWGQSFDPRQEWLAEGKHSELNEMASLVMATSELRPNAR